MFGEKCTLVRPIEASVSDYMKHKRMSMENEGEMNNLFTAVKVKVLHPIYPRGLEIRLFLQPIDGSCP